MIAVFLEKMIKEDLILKYLAKRDNAHVALRNVNRFYIAPTTNAGRN